MNRNITLILSTLVVVVLLAVWIYLMFFAAPKDQDLIEGSGTYSEFGEFGEDDPDGTGVASDDSDDRGFGADTTDDGQYNPDILRQLTTKNVIGYREIDIASTTYVVYMESGVGHIYSINLGTAKNIKYTHTANRITTITAERMRVIFRFIILIDYIDIPF